MEQSEAVLSYVMFRSVRPLAAGEHVDIRTGGYRRVGSLYGRESDIQDYVITRDPRYYRGRYYGDWRSVYRLYTMQYPGTWSIAAIVVLRSADGSPLRPADITIIDMGGYTMDPTADPAIHSALGEGAINRRAGTMGDSDSDSGVVSIDDIFDGSLPDRDPAIDSAGGTMGDSDIDDGAIDAVVESMEGLSINRDPAIP